MSLQYHALNSIQSTNFLSSTKTTLSSSFLTISGESSSFSLSLSCQRHTITHNHDLFFFFSFISYRPSLKLCLQSKSSCGFNHDAFLDWVFDVFFDFGFLIFPREQNKNRVMTLFLCSLNTHAWSISHHHHQYYSLLSIFCFLFLQSIIESLTTLQNSLCFLFVSQKFDLFIFFDIWGSSIQIGNVFFSGFTKKIKKCKCVIGSLLIFEQNKHYCF